MYYSSPVICAGTNNRSIYIGARENYQSRYERNIKSMQGEGFPGKRVSLGDILSENGAWYLLGEHS